MKYRMIEHGGDIEIEVYGKTAEELLSNCIFSSADVILPVAGLACDSEITLEYSYSDYPNLIVQIISDIIGEFEINDTLYFHVNSMSAAGRKANIALCGHKFDKTPDACNVLKAVTYHNLVFDPGRGIARITFDI